MPDDLQYPILAGIDTGGTFTDFVVLHNGRLQTHKVLSTPGDPLRAILQGLDDLGLLENRGRMRMVHGSTIVTNAALEGKGVRTAFVVNAGFEDLLLLGRQARDALYDLTPEPAGRCFPDTRAFGVPVRRDAAGVDIKPLTEEAIADLERRLAEFAPEAVAICLLFSYRDAADEERLARALARSDHEYGFVTTSASVLPCYREYERGVATWLNAWLGPFAENHLSRLQESLAPTPCAIMQSSGKTLSVSEASRSAVHLLLSGPAGGVAAAAELARRHDRTRLLTFDMGGTSTDVSLIDGEIALTDGGSIGPYPVAIPMIDIHTIGAGGGSLAHLDPGGMLKVGPQSAGADPGPACYGLGGRQATVTDANLHLGLLVADAFAAGAARPSARLAEDALLRLGHPLNMSAAQVAVGIVRIANENMSQALRSISLERGLDPADFTLCCYGGAGGLHVCAVAENLGIDNVLIPAEAGVFSAFGMLVAPPGRELTRSLQQPVSALSTATVERVLRELRRDGENALAREGVERGQIRCRYTVTLRYLGQSHALPVAWTSLSQATGDFVELHESLYGYRLQMPIELVNLCVSVVGRGAAPPLPEPDSRASGKSSGYSQCFQFGRTPVYWRKDMRKGRKIPGPAMVLDPVATSLIAPGWEGVLEAGCCLRLQRA